MPSDQRREGTCSGNRVNIKQRVGVSCGVSTVTPGRGGLRPTTLGSRYVQQRRAGCLHTMSTQPKPPPRQHLSSLTPARTNYLKGYYAIWKTQKPQSQVITTCGIKQGRGHRTSVQWVRTPTNIPWSSHPPECMLAAHRGCSLQSRAGGWPLCSAL